MTYFTIGIGYFGSIVVYSLFILVQGLLSGADYWISFWFDFELFKQEISPKFWV